MRQPQRDSGPGGHQRPGSYRCARKSHRHLVAMAAVATLAANPEKGQPFVQVLWDIKTPTGRWRYYDGLLYMLAWLHISGNFRIYTPALP